MRIEYYHNHSFIDQLGKIIPPETPISTDHHQRDVVSDMETHSNITGCDEVIIVNADNAEEITTTVIDLDPNLPKKEKHDDFIIVMEQKEPPEVEKGKEKVNDYVVIDVQEEMDALSKINPTAKTTSSQLSKMFWDLKTYDSSLKVMAGMFKVLGLENESKLVKKIRGFVKYVMGMKTVAEGKTVIDLTKIHGSRKERTEVIRDLFTYSGLLSGAMEFVSAQLKNEKFTEYVGNYGASCEAVARLFGVPTAGLKLVYKMSSFQSNLEMLDQKDTDESLFSIKNIIIIRSGVDAAKDVAKMALLLAGYTNPIIATTLAVTEIASGCAGLYLMYNR